MHIYNYNFSLKDNKLPQQREILNAKTSVDIHHLLRTCNDLWNSYLLRVQYLQDKFFTTQETRKLVVKC